MVVTTNCWVFILKKKKKGKLKYDFENPAYDDPTEESEKHIYKEACPPVATYEQPEELVGKSHDKTNSAKVLEYSFVNITAYDFGIELKLCIEILCLY